MSRYLAGVASLTLKPADLESARYYLEHASNMIEKIKKNATENDEVSYCIVLIVTS